MAKLVLKIVAIGLKRYLPVTITVRNLRGRVAGDVRERERERIEGKRDVDGKKGCNAWYPHRACSKLVSKQSIYVSLSMCVCVCVFGRMYVHRGLLAMCDSTDGVLVEGGWWRVEGS